MIIKNSLDAFHIKNRSRAILISKSAEKSPFFFLILKHKGINAGESSNILPVYIITDEAVL